MGAKVLAANDLGAKELAVKKVGVKRGNGRSRVRRGKNGTTSVESINFGPLATWIGFNLRMAQEAAFQAFSRLSQEIGESPGRFATLTLIARNPGISQTELSQAAGRDKSSLTPVVEDLVRRGLVERKRLNHDRRAYCLNVTRDGKKTLATMMRCARRHERNLDKIIGLRDRARFLEILKKLAAGIE
ncbi:MAG: MarR family winged helix-turn-helix transcriptional regulator [Candidatus Binatia bacterium]